MEEQIVASQTKVELDMKEVALNRVLVPFASDEQEFGKQLLSIHPEEPKMFQWMNTRDRTSN